MDPVTPTDGSTYFGFKPAQEKPKLDMNTFLRLLTTQLANQNPLEPMNDRDFFAQMAQLGNVQGLDDLKKSMNISQAQTLIGKQVTAIRPAGTYEAGTDGTVSGIVKGMTTKNGKQFVQIEQADGGLVDIEPGSITGVSESTSSGSLEGLNIVSASSLLGKQVVAIDATRKDEQGNYIVVKGTVEKVNMQDGQFMAVVNDGNGHKIRVLVSNISEVGN